MYFLQHLLFPGKLVSAEEREQADVASYKVKDLSDLAEQQRQQVQCLPTDFQELLFSFAQLPPVSTPNAFPPDFPVAKLPPTLQSSEKYTSAVYQCLQAVDPDMAQRWHWRDIRKVSRSLQVFLQTGRQHSAIMREQAQTVQETQYVREILLPMTYT